MTAVCAVCSTGPAKYKCPECQSPSCSLECSKSHKDCCEGKSPNYAEDTGNEAQGSLKHEGSPTKAVSDRPRKPLTTFAKLESSSELQQLLSKYSSLRSQLRQIHKCTKPPEPATEEQPTDSRSFGNKGRSRTNDRGNWSAEKGFDRGLSLLKRLRDGDSGDSEGLGEFSQLVHMVIPVEGMEEFISRP